MQTRIAGDSLQDKHFFFLREGDNYIIVLSPPYHHKAHYGRDVGGNVRKLNCSLTSDCPGCIKKYDTSDRWFFKIFDVSSLSVKLLDACFSIVQQMSDKVEEMKRFPINIKKTSGDPLNPKMVKYEVEVMNSNLSEKDWNKIRDEDINFDMNDISRPRTVEEILSRIRGE